MKNYSQIIFGWHVFVKLKTLISKKKNTRLSYILYNKKLKSQKLV
jgi:hypothetical protein